MWRTLPLGIRHAVHGEEDSDLATCPVEQLQHSLYCSIEEEEVGLRLTGWERARFNILGGYPNQGRTLGQPVDRKSVV